MKVPRCGFISILAFSALLLSLLLTTKSASGQGTTQTVRLSYVEGDVRLSRGNGMFPDLSAPWQQAQADVPIEEGFSLATGSGRAEIEFENGSTVYLAPNSVLIFKYLYATDLSIEALATQIELATGTATIDLHPALHQSFSIETPGGSVRATLPQAAFMRVDSYLDAMALTPLEDMKLNEPDSQGKTATKGRTAYFSANSTASIAAPIDEPADTASSAEWDQWVSARVEQRKADTAAALKASGLSAPFPGLTDLYQNGTFFACAPYGTCWQQAQEPAATPQGAQPPIAPPTVVALEPSSAQSAATAPQSASVKSKGATANPLLTEEYIPLNSCFVRGLLIQTAIDTKTGKPTVLTTPVPSKLLRWPLCYEGNWIRRHRRFVFVVKHHHHPRPPVVWVRVGKQVGYVPRHPKDVDGKPPINLKYGVFVPQSKSGESVKRVPYNESAKMEILAQPPKQFRSQSLPSLEKTERPEIEAHILVRAPAYSGTGSKISESPILYDFKSQKFVEKETVADGHALKPEVVAIFNSRGEFGSPETGRYAGYHFASSVSSAAGSGRIFTSRSSTSSRGSSSGGSSANRASAGRGGSNASRGGSGGSTTSRRGEGASGGGSSASRGSGGGGGGASHGGGGGGGSMGGGGSSGGGGGGGGGGSSGGHGPH